MPRTRAVFGVSVGALALVLGLGLRISAWAGQRDLAADPRLPWVGLALALAAILAAWIARPRAHLALALGLLPLAGLLGLVFPILALFDPEARIALVPAGLESAGAFTLLLSALRFLDAQAMAVFRPHERWAKQKVQLVREDAPKKRPEVPAASLVRGDEVALGPGEQVPADGVLLQGAGFVDEAVLAGSSLPVPKRGGDLLFAGTRSSIPQLVMRVEVPQAESLEVLRERRDAALAESLVAPDRRAWTLGIAAVVIGLAGAVAVVARHWELSVIGALPALAALGLAVLAAAPALALARGRLGVLAQAQRGGLLLGRSADLERLARVRRWQLDPLLLAAPGKVEALALADAPPDVLLAAADALLVETPTPEHLAIRAEMQKKGLPLRRGAAFKHDAGVWRGTVDGGRWYLGPRGALAEELEPSAEPALAYLAERSDLVLLLGREGEGVVGALGLVLAVDPEYAKLARDLGATLSPGLPDATRGALAKHAEIVADGPPLGARDATLVAETSVAPSAGLRLRVVTPRPGYAPKEGASPRVLAPAITRLPQVVEGAAGAERSGLMRALFVGLAVPAGAALLAYFGVLIPAAGAVAGAVALFVAAQCQGRRDGGRS